MCNIPSVRASAILLMKYWLLGSLTPINLTRTMKLRGVRLSETSALSVISQYGGLLTPSYCSTLLLIICKTATREFTFIQERIGN